MTKQQEYLAVVEGLQTLQGQTFFDSYEAAISFGNFLGENLRVISNALKLAAIAELLMQEPSDAACEVEKGV